MNSTERSTRVFAGIATFLVVFFVPKLLPVMFDDSLPTVLWGLIALAAAWVAVCLVSLKQRVKRLEMQARHLQAQLDDLAKQTGVLP